MELTHMTLMPTTKLVAFTLTGTDGEETQGTLVRRPGETLTDCAARVEDWLRDLQLGLKKPLNSS